MAQRNKAARPLTSKTCKDISDLVHAYLSDKLTAKTKTAFQEHIKICRDCVNFLNTYKKTVKLTRRLDPARLPTRVRENILSFLRKQTGRLGMAFVFLLSRLAA